MARWVDQLDKMVAADHREKTELDPMLKHLTSEYSTVSLQLINSKYNGMNEQSILNLISSADNLRDKIDMVINKRINMENTEIQNEITKAGNSVHAQQAEIIIASIAACTASIAIGRHISLNSIIKPLLKLKQATVQIAHGDFGFTELKSFARDEIGELSVQFENMRQTLNQRTKDLNLLTNNFLWLTNS
jgi:methyl-accepting chemotaxis protein